MTLSVGSNLGLLIRGAPSEAHYQQLLAQWRGLDALVQPSVIGRVASLPTSGMVDGDRYLFVGTGTNANKIARYREANTESALTAGWEYFTPKEGWQIWSVADFANYRFRAAAWAVEPVDGAVINRSDTAISLKTSDSGGYLRATSNSAVTVTVPAQATAPWGDSTEIRVRAAGTGNVTLAPASGVVLNKPAGGSFVLSAGMMATLKRVGPDAWDVFGQTVAG